MILVTEAGYHGTVAFSANSTLPVSASISSAASFEAAEAQLALIRIAVPKAATNIEGRTGDTKFTGGVRFCLRASGRVLVHSMFVRFKS